VREIDDDEGRRLVRIVRRDSGSVVTWRRAQMVLLPAQGMDVATSSGATTTPTTNDPAGSSPGQTLPEAAPAGHQVHIHARVIARISAAVSASYI
jgi:hypothetical protein